MVVLCCGVVHPSVLVFRNCFQHVLRYQFEAVSFFCNGSLIIKREVKLGIWDVFGRFLKMFLIWDHKTWFTGTLWALPGHDNTAYADYMKLTVCCPRKAVKFNHSLTHSFPIKSVLPYRSASINKYPIFSSRTLPIHFLKWCCLVNITPPNNCQYDIFQKVFWVHYTSSTVVQEVQENNWWFS